MPRVFVPAVLSGVLLWAAFFPLDLGFLGFISLVPWLALVRADVSRRRRYFAAYLGGFVFSALATNWVRVAHPMMYFSWLAFSLILPLFWLLALFFIRRLDRLGVPLAFSVAIGWVAIEYMRMHFPTGYPFLKPLGLYHMIGFGWYFLGYTQHDFLPLIQIADVGGVYAVSFLVAAVNGLIADWLLRMPVVRRWLRTHPVANAPGSPSTPTVGGRPVLSSLVVFVLFGGYLAYGFVRLQHPEFAPGPRVAAIQGSVPQNEKMLKGDTLAKTYYHLHIEAMNGEPKADLIVWPETCFPDDWLEVLPGQTPVEGYAQAAGECEHFFSMLRLGSPTLLGLTALEWEGNRPWKYNAALLIDTRGKKVARYDKMHLVPFGEYVPLGETFPFLQALTPYNKEYSCRPGSHWTRFPLKVGDRDFTFACLICYEDSDPSLARQYVATEPVNFFVNISNDGWFDGTEEHEEHLAICRFRAIEARRSIVRAVNMGISGVIDSDGRVVALPGPTWSQSKKVEGVVSAVVPLDNRGSLYAMLGDWIPAACWLVVLVGIVAASVWKKAAPTA